MYIYTHTHYRSSTSWCIEFDHGSYQPSAGSSLHGKQRTARQCRIYLLCRAGGSWILNFSHCVTNQRLSATLLQRLFLRIGLKVTGPPFSCYCWTGVGGVTWVFENLMLVVRILQNVLFGSFDDLLDLDNSPATCSTSLFGNRPWQRKDSYLILVFFPTSWLPRIVGLYLWGQARVRIIDPPGPALPGYSSPHTILKHPCWKIPGV